MKSTIQKQKEMGKSKFRLSGLAGIIAILMMIFTLSSCHRDDDEIKQDDLPQEEMTNVILKVTNQSGVTSSYDYNIAAGSSPVIKLNNGQTYNVEAVFMNGNEDVTQEIRDAKDEHFLIFDFPKSNIALTRIDGVESTRTDGKKVGLKTQWVVTTVVNSSSPVLKMRLIHEPASVNEAQNGTAWGSVTGGETDADTTYGLSN